MDLTKAIQLAVGKMQVLKFHSPVCENVSHLYNHEIDVLSVSKSNMTYEFEVKITRSDFIADKKKRKWNFMESLKEKHTNYFSYVCPVGMIQPEEVQDFAGLYYYDDILDEVTEIKNPKKIHNTKYDRVTILEKVARVNSERQYLGCCRLTYNNNLVKERNANNNGIK